MAFRCVEAVASFFDQMSMRVFDLEYKLFHNLPIVCLARQWCGAVHSPLSVISFNLYKSAMAFQLFMATQPSGVFMCDFQNFDIHNLQIKICETASRYSKCMELCNLQH